MTSYNLYPGYSSEANQDEVWLALKQASEEVCKAPPVIFMEVFRLEKDHPRDLLLECVTCYSDATECPAQVIDSEERGRSIYSTASGGGEYRPVKEACRRAFARLVIEKMHKQGLEVSLTVS